MSERNSSPEATPLFRPAQAEIAVAADSKELFEEIGAGYERLEATARLDKTELIARLDGEVQQLADKIFDATGRALTGRVPDGLPDYLGRLEAVASSVEDNRPRITPEQFARRRHEDETLEDVRDRAYIRERTNKKAGQTHVAKQGQNQSPEDISSGTAQVAVDERAERTKKIVYRRLYAAFGDSLREVTQLLDERAKEQAVRRAA